MEILWKYYIEALSNKLRKFQFKNSFFRFLYQNQNLIPNEMKEKFLEIVGNSSFLPVLYNMKF